MGILLPAEKGRSCQILLSTIGQILSFDDQLCILGKLGYLAKGAAETFYQNLATMTFKQKINDSFDDYVK